MSEKPERTLPLDLTAIRAKLDGVQGRDYWRSLEELAETPEFQRCLDNEFPRQGMVMAGSIDRRNALKLMAASLALAGMSACTVQPTEKIVPYVRAPEDLVYGKPLFFATAMPLGGSAIGLLVESHEGRPTKVEGNPRHPASLGATDVFAQASVLTLYDPDRSQVTMLDEDISNWFAFVSALGAQLDSEAAGGGAGLRILTESVISPSLAAQMRAVLAKFPAAKWHQYQPLNDDSAQAGAQMALGQRANIVYRFDQAEIVLALDSDFLASGSTSVRYSHDFISRRRIDDGRTEEPGLRRGSIMNRLYAVESMYTSTGAAADHRLPMSSSGMGAFALALAAKLGIGAGAARANLPAAGQKFLDALARDLRAHRGASAIIAGDHQSAIVHALVHAMNQALGNVGKTVVFIDPLAANAVDQMQSLGELAGDMSAGKVRALLILSGNPVYTAPVDLDFRGQLDKVPFTAHLGLYLDETASACHWRIPEAHFLESWGDTRAFDGTVTIMQPLIAPLYAGKTAYEVLAAVLGRSDASAYDIVRSYWQNQAAPAARGNFDQFWQVTLDDGVVANSASPPKTLAVNTTFLAREASALSTAAATSQPGGKQAPVEIVFRPDPTVYDGRFANNGWLQELPKPFSKITWDNALYLSPNTAGRLGIQYNEQVVEIHYQGRMVAAPAWILPGHADDSISLSLGYGRSKSGKLGTGIGSNAYSIRTAGQPRIGAGATVQATSGRVRLASTQPTQALAGRNMIRSATLEEFLAKPNFVHSGEYEPASQLTLYPGFKYQGYAWGMLMDLSACVGCNACMIACQAENNIPVVGKTEVARGRAMHWLRIDTYYKGGFENPEAHFEPMACVQCENAPCELVCPVAATTHSSEGINQMVYNRCVGTRYCSNNCPYKTRRFNFLLYNDWYSETLKFQRNPDVSVRSRGVMEKCTYCIQRIQEAKIEAEKQDRRLQDGEIRTACQQACPTQAIVFGDINDPNSQVAKLKQQQRNYGVLEELNTRPRTTYLGRVWNPNPELPEEKEGDKFGSTRPKHAPSGLP